MASQTPIVQFGTSRFLQAHVDLFVSEALGPGDADGPITVVQTTSSADSRRRIAAFNDQGSFPVLIRGLQDGVAMDRRVEVRSVSRALDASTQWARVEEIVVGEASAIVSNTGDRGYELDAADTVDTAVPRSFPAKLTRLLLARHRAGQAGLDLFPCELVNRNGEVLRDTVLSVARGWGLEAGFIDWLNQDCRWVNSLVDRIVSEALDPIGAVAEPYALWAIEAQPGLTPLCAHPAIILTEDLERYERLKLLILNLGHSFLVERWLAEARPATETVREALDDASLRCELDDLYDREVLPVFEALGMGAEAGAYRAVVIERFRNPFLRHRLADIASNHAVKKQRRFGLIIALAEKVAPDLAQPRLRGALGA